MKHITAQQMQAFNDELTKQAGTVGRVADFAKKHLAGRYGRQVALGAGVGAVGGAATAGKDADTGTRLRRALVGGLGGATLAGGRALATKGGRAAAKKSVGDFAQKQIYTMTGKGIEGTPAQRLKKAKELGIITADPSKAGAGGPGILERAKEKITGRSALSPKAKAFRDQFAQEHAFQKGYMNIPGVAHGLMTQPGQLIRSGWDRAGVAGKAFAGYGAYEAGKGFLKKPEEGGPGRLEAGLRGAGSTLGYLVAPGAAIGQAAIGGGLGALGGKIGKGATSAGQMAGAARDYSKLQKDPRYQQWEQQQGQGGQ